MWLKRIFWLGQLLLAAGGLGCSVVGWGWGFGYRCPLASNEVVADIRRLLRFVATDPYSAPKNARRPTFATLRRLLPAASRPSLPALRHAVCATAASTATLSSRCSPFLCFFVFFFFFHFFALAVRLCDIFYLTFLDYAAGAAAAAPLVHFYTLYSLKIAEKRSRVHN